MGRIEGTVASVLALVVLGGLPACADDAGAEDATHFLTRLQSVAPEVSGLEVEILENGSRIEVTNRSDDEVVVFGYQGEPYLRIGPDGVAENLRSPATYINQDRQGTTAVPGSADPEADPEWSTVSDGNVARWHDHRIHWMGSSDPPAVQGAPDESHVVIPEWTVPMRAGTTPVTATGDLLWVPGESTLVWWGVAVAALAGTVLVAMSSVWRAGLVVALVAMVAVDAGSAWGIASAVAGSWGDRASELGPAGLVSVAGWVAGAVGIVLLVSGRAAALYLAVLAGACIAAESLTRADRLVEPELLFTGPASISRAATALGLGLGIGLVVGGASRLLRRETPAPGEPRRGADPQLVVGDSGAAG